MTSATLASPRRVRTEEPEWLVWALVIIMLAAGLLLRGLLVGRTAHFDGGGVSLNYPARWTILAAADPTQAFGAADAFADNQTPSEVRVWQLPTSEVNSAAQSVGDLALAWSARLAEQVTGYNVLGLAQISAAGQPAVALDYAYVTQPAPGAMPVVVRAQDVLLRRGNRLTVVSFAAAADAYAGQAATWRSILATLEWK